MTRSPSTQPRPHLASCSPNHKNYDVSLTLPKNFPSIITALQMPNTPHSTTNPYHLPLLLCIFTLAFFPSAIIPLLYSPLTLLTYSASLLPWSSSTASPLHQETSTTTTLSWAQKQFTLPAKARGSYLITDIVMDKVPEIKEFKVGVLQLFVQHTSCALSLNENYDEDVRYVFLPFPPSLSLHPFSHLLTSNQRRHVRRPRPHRPRRP
jgi:hypothetical protein